IEQINFQNSIVVKGRSGNDRPSDEILTLLNEADEIDMQIKRLQQGKSEEFIYWIVHVDTELYITKPGEDREPLQPLNVYLSLAEISSKFRNATISKVEESAEKMDSVYKS